MLKNKSLEDINRVGNDELFTELTPKEAAVIEGGGILTLEDVTWLSTTDPEPSEVCIYVAGTDTLLYQGPIANAVNRRTNVRGARVTLTADCCESGPCGQSLSYGQVELRRSYRGAEDEFEFSGGQQSGLGLYYFLT